MEITAKVLEYSKDPVEFRGASYRMCCMGPTLIQENGVYNRQIIVDYAADMLGKQHEAEAEGEQGEAVEETQADAE